MSELTVKSFDKKYIRCTDCTIRSYSFCRCLKEDQLDIFSRISKERELINKQTVFLQEENSTHIYNITEGNVKIYKLLRDGRIQIIGFLYPGDFLGSCEKGKYNYSAEAIGKVKLCTFTQEIMNDFLEKNINFAKELLHMTSHELTLAQDRIGVLGKLKANERVATFILNISKQRARIGWQDNPISLPMNRQDIADYLGLTLETVSREITKLKTANLIKILSSNQIYIQNKKDLLNMSTQI